MPMPPAMTFPSEEEWMELDDYQPEFQNIQGETYVLIGKLTEATIKPGTAVYARSRAHIRLSSKRGPVLEYPAKMVEINGRPVLISDVICTCPSCLGNPESQRCNLFIVLEPDIPRKYFSPNKLAATKALWSVVAYMIEAKDKTDRFDIKCDLRRRWEGPPPTVSRKATVAPPVDPTPIASRKTTFAPEELAEAIESAAEAPSECDCWRCKEAAAAKPPSRKPTIAETAPISRRTTVQPSSTRASSITQPASPTPVRTPSLAPSEGPCNCWRCREAEAQPEASPRRSVSSPVPQPASGPHSDPGTRITSPSVHQPRDDWSPSVILGSPEPVAPAPIPSRRATVIPESEGYPASVPYSSLSPVPEDRESAASPMETAPMSPKTVQPSRAPTLARKASVSPAPGRQPYAPASRQQTVAMSPERSRQPSVEAAPSTPLKDLRAAIKDRHLGQRDRDANDQKMTIMSEALANLEQNTASAQAVNEEGNEELGQLTDKFGWDLLGLMKRLK